MAQKNSVTLQVLALADQVISADDGKKSIIGIFDKIFVRKLPSSHPRMVLFITLLGEVGASDTVELSIIAPAERELDRRDLQFKCGENGRANIIVNMEGFLFQETGRFYLLLQQKGLELGRYSFEVIRIEESRENKLVS